MSKNEPSSERRTKTCSRCKIARPVSEFNVQSERRDGLNSWCKGCLSIARRASRYGMTFDGMRDLLAASDGRCQVCATRARLVIDHDHGSGKVRGLLCWRCNTGIAILDRNDDLLESALEYLA